MKRRFAHTCFAITIARHRLLAAALVTMAMAMAVFGVFRIEFEQDIRRAFQSNDRHGAALQRLSESLAFSTRPIMVLIEASEGFNRENLVRLRDAAIDLALLDNVDQVLSPFSFTYPPNHPERTHASVLIPEDAEPPDLFSSLREFTDGRMGMRTMVNERGNALVLTVFPARGIDLHQTKALIGTIDEELAPLTSIGLTAAVTGEDAISLAVVSSLQRDLPLLMVLGAVLSWTPSGFKPLNRRRSSSTPGSSNTTRSDLITRSTCNRRFPKPY